MNRPKILLYLHHVELGQRYPISEDVIIGRRTGHILFPKDERLNDQHCRIVTEGDGRLFIRDLGSVHGTVVDGRLLSPEKTYEIRDGTLIVVGGQAFKCVEPKRRTVKKKTKRRPPPRGFDLTWLIALLLAVGAGAFAARYNKPLLPTIQYYAQLLRAGMRERLKAERELPPAPPMETPFEIVYRELEEAFQEYRDLGTAVQSGMDKKAMALELRNNLIPKYQAAREKLQVIKPSSESERRRMEANAKLVNAILKQILAMASFAETSNPKYQLEVERLTTEVEAANADAKRVNDRRVPAADN